MSLTGAARYAAVSSLVSALKSKLASGSEYERLIGSSSLKEVLDFFQERYGQLVIYRQAGDEMQLHQTIDADYYRTARIVRAFSPPGLRKVINAILERDELQVLASILKVVADGAESETLRSTLVPTGDYDEERIKLLLETRSLRRAVETIEDAELRESLLTAINEPGLRANAAVDLAIQSVLARKLWRATKVFLAGQHAESSKRILGQWLDLQNIMLLVRSRSLGLTSTEVRSFLMPVHYRLQQTSIEDMARSSSTADIIRQLDKTPYRRATADYQQGSTSELATSSLETSLNRYFATQCVLAFAGWRFSAGLAVAFLFLKILETQDLKAILTGKAKSIPPSVIWRDIVLHPPPVGQR